MNRIHSSLILVLIGLLLCLSCRNQKKATQASVHKGSSAKAEQVILEANKLMFSPYKYGGNTPDGFDCSGMTQYVFNKFDVKLPHNSEAQAIFGIDIERRDAQPGDLIFFKGQSGDQIGHVGIITKTYPNGIIEFISSTSSKGVILQSTQLNYWETRFVKIKRLVLD